MRCRTAAVRLRTDTSPHVHALMMARFTSMTIAERAEAAQELNDMCTTIAIAGIRAQHAAT